jgi:hypothetical protein
MNDDHEHSSFGGKDSHMQDHTLPQLSEEQAKDRSLSQTHDEETPRSQTLSSQEMPQWLRSELEAGKQEGREEVGTTPEDTEREARSLRDELASTQRQMGTLRHQHSSVQEHPYTVQRERGGCLTAWLVFVGVVNVLALIFGFTMTNTLGPLSLLSVANGAIVLIGVVGTWQLKKWGYYTLLALYLIGFVASFLVVSVTVFPLISSLIGLGITSVLVLDRWEDFE